MTMIDYLLLGGFVVAGGYTICRLFVGFRNSSAAPARMDRTEEARQAEDAETAGRAGSVTRAPWQPRNWQKKED